MFSLLHSKEFNISHTPSNSSKLTPMVPSVGGLGQLRRIC